MASERVVKVSLNEPAVGFSKVELKKRLTWPRMAFLAFAGTCAGPFGLEILVESGGPLAALMCLAAIPLFHALPAILITTELSGWMPTNHGPIRWVDRAFGHFASFVVACAVNAQQLIDVAAYPVLFCDYLSAQFYSDMPPLVRLGIRMAFIGIMCIPAFRGASDASLVQAILGIIACMPFLVGGIAGIGGASPKDWTGMRSDIDFGKLLSAALWMYNGFFAMANLGGEVENSTVFIKGGVFALVTGVLVYTFPLIVGLQVKGKWHDGFLATAFDKILPGLGNAVAVAGCCASVALFLACTLTCSRGLWSMADLGWLPKVFLRTSSSGCPYVAVILVMISATCLSQLSLSMLVHIELASGVLMFQFFYLTFLVLRYREPKAPRPWTVPGGRAGATLLILPITIILFALFVTSLFDWHIVIVLVVFFVVTGLLYRFVARDAVKSAFVHEAKKINDDAASSPPSSKDSTSEEKKPLNEHEAPSGDAPPPASRQEEGK